MNIGEIGGLFVVLPLVVGILAIGFIGILPVALGIQYVYCLIFQQSFSFIHSLRLIGESFVAMAVWGLLFSLLLKSSATGGNLSLQRQFLQVLIGFIIGVFHLFNLHRRGLIDLRQPIVIVVGVITSLLFALAPTFIKTIIVPLF